MRKSGRVMSEFKINGRFCIGIGNGAAIVFFGGGNNLIRCLEISDNRALMVLPFITSVTRDIFQMVPSVVKESAYGMGSTTWEVTRKVTRGESPGSSTTNSGSSI